MFLDSIILFASKFTNIEKKRIFNLAAQAMSSIYKGKLHKYNTISYFKVCVEEWNILPDISKIPLPLAQDSKDIEYRKKRIAEGTYFYESYIENLLDVLAIHRRFDFEKWFASDKLTRKSMMVVEIYQSMLYLAEKFKWETEPLHNAYNACVAQNFENNWYIKKFTKTSPNRKYTGNVWVEYDIDSFRTYLEVKSEKLKVKNENLEMSGEEYVENDINIVIVEKKIVDVLDYEDENANPLCDTDKIFKGKTKWEKDSFVLYSDKGEEIGRVQNTIPKINF